MAERIWQREWGCEEEVDERLGERKIHETQDERS
jgi:hypothetical protein